MLKRLRIQLTALYILVALSLVVLTGLGAYYLVSYYFQRETDLALEYKMATEFRSYGLIPPPELAIAEKSWLGVNAHEGSTSTPEPESTATPFPTLTDTPLPTFTSIPTSIPTSVPTSTPLPTSTPAPTRAPALVQPARPPSQPSGGEGDDGEGEDNSGGKAAVSTSPEDNSGGQVSGSTGQEDIGGGSEVSSGFQTVAPTPLSSPATNVVSSHTERSDQAGDEGYDSELASIYVLPLTASGQVIPGPNLTNQPFPRNDQASLAAMVNGYDWRTVRQADGTRVRLLTYRLSNPGGPAILQMGSTLTYQDRVLSQFMVGLLILGAITSVLLGIGSWWLSGRSLSPAQHAWDQQQAFVSNASHELRTPLTLIRATAEVGLRSHPDSEQKEFLEGIVDETDYMNRLVDDLLLLSRLDTHRLQLAHEAVSLDDLLEDTARQAERLGAGKSIRVEVGAAQGAVWGDRTRLRQVLLILLDNALRFSPPGGTIRMEAVEHGKHRKMRQLIVRDQGGGIPPEHLPHVFERFYQASSPVDPLTRTNGLGLSIAKGLVEAQGGEIHIQSWVGKGTQVIVELPSADQS